MREKRGLFSFLKLGSVKPVPQVPLTPEQQLQIQEQGQSLAAPVYDTNVAVQQYIEHDVKAANAVNVNEADWGVLGQAVESFRQAGMDLAPIQNALMEKEGVSVDEKQGIAPIKFQGQNVGEIAVREDDSEMIAYSREDKTSRIKDQVNALNVVTGREVVIAPQDIELLNHQRPAVTVLKVVKRQQPKLVEPEVVNSQPVYQETEQQPTNPFLAAPAVWEEKKAA